MIKVIDSFLDRHFANAYKLRVRRGDLVLYKGQNLCIEKVISDTEYICSTCNENKKDKISNSEQRYKFSSINPKEDKIFKWWGCWIAE